MESINPPIDKMKNNIGGSQLLGLIYIVSIVPTSTIKKTPNFI